MRENAQERNKFEKVHHSNSTTQPQNKGQTLLESMNKQLADGEEIYQKVRVQHG